MRLSEFVHTAKTNVKHVEQARAEVTVDGNPAFITLNLEKPTRFYLHLFGKGVPSQVLDDTHDPRMALKIWNEAMRKYKGKLIQRKAEFFKRMAAEVSTMGIHRLSAIAQKLASESAKWERLDSHGRGHPAKHYAKIDKQFGVMSAPEYSAFDHLYNHHLRALLDAKYREKADNIAYINKMLQSLATRYKLRIDWDAPKRRPYAG